MLFESINEAVRGLDRITLCVASKTFMKVDVVCAARPDEIPRGTCIAEAVAGKLAGDLALPTFCVQGRCGHG